MKTSLISLKACLAIPLTLAVSFVSNAQVLDWGYKDWTAQKTNDQYYKFVTHGNVAYGNEFGFLVNADKCDTENFWLTIGTYNKGLDTYKGKSVQFDVDVDGTGFKITAPLLNTVSVGTIKVGLFSNVAIDASFREALSDGKSVRFTIPESDPAFYFFDIPTESFSLSGITATHLKAKAACLNSDAEFVKTKREIETIDNDFESAEKAYYSSESSFFDEYSFNLINEKCSKGVVISKLLQNTDPYAVSGNIMFTGKGNDGDDKYPRITVNNLCAPDDSSLITDIPLTDSQIFSMKTYDNKLYVMSNYNNRPYVTSDLSLATLQEFDISDLSNIKLNRELVINSLAPNFSVFDDKVFIENEDEILTLDISLPKNFILDGSESLRFDKYFSSDVLATKDSIFVSGNNQLIVIDRNGERQHLNYTFKHRTADLFLLGDYILMLGWKNGVSGSYLKTLKIDNDQVLIVDQLLISHRIYEPHQFGDTVLGRFNSEIISLDENGSIILTKNIQ